MSPILVPTLYSSFSSIFTAHFASSLHHASIPPDALPPTPAELLRPCHLRGSVDTVRYNLFRANPRTSSLIAITAAGFEKIPPKENEKDNENAREVWYHPAGVSITHSRNGTSVTIHPARLAYGRNDRVSDLRHAGIPPLMRWLTEELLIETTEGERERARGADRTWVGSSLIGRWRTTTLHLAAHLWVEDEREADALLRIIALARLGRQRSAPRVFAHGRAADREIAHSVQLGVGLTGNRAERGLNVYNKGRQERDSRFARRMLERCGGEALHSERVLRFEVQFNTAAAIAGCPLLIGGSSALDDQFGEPAIPFVDPETKRDASVLIGEERCHAVIMEAIRELFAYAAPWPSQEVRSRADWKALRMRADRFAQRWMREDLPARCVGVDPEVRSLAMRLLIRQMMKPRIVHRIYPIELPMIGVGLPNRIRVARTMARNRSA